MKHLKCLVALACALLVVAVSSCKKQQEENEPIGKWEAMQWTSDTAETLKKGPDGRYSIIIPPQGGTYVFRCLNYSNLRLAEAVEYRGKTDGHTQSLGKWFKVEAKGNTLTVVYQPNEEGATRLLGLVVIVEEGDAFCQFAFAQR